MSQNRKLPFGYHYRNGAAIPDVQEAPYVRKIVQAYLDGNSIQTIAQWMNNTGVSYRDDAKTWNKNMISRILADQRYGGTSSWPALLPKEMMAALQIERSARRQIQLPVAEIRNVRSKIYCSRCFTHMTRRTNRRKNGICWYCPTCHIATEPITDADLLSLIHQRICWLQQHPELIVIPPTSVTISNEYQMLNQELERKLCDPIIREEDLCVLARQSAEELYRCIKGGDCAAESEQIRYLLSHVETQEESFSNKLFDSIVHKVLLETENCIQLQLTNFQTV